MNLPRLNLGDAVSDFLDWFTATFRAIFNIFKAILDFLYQAFDSALTWPYAPVIILLLAAVAWWVRNWRFAVAVAVGLALINTMNQWDNAMHTLALVLVASIIAVALAIPLGIIAARNAMVSRGIRPILDFFQTMPAFVYLIPAVMIFKTGVAPGIVATILFAMPVGVRLTELGIRQVDREIVEAGQAFGKTPGQILREIQLPLALPSIMAGINQMIMLALSMVVIAGLVGAPGLGQQVTQSLSTVDVALGVESGLSVVILAIVLDRMTAAVGERSKVARALKVAA